MVNLPIFVDIDGTLTANPHQPWGAAVEHRIERVREDIAKGVTIVIWSARGEAYATEFAKRHRIEGALCIGKPGTCVDDNPTIRRREIMPVLSPREYFGR